MLRELLAIPETTCPRCGESRARWGERLTAGPLRLMLARLCAWGRRLVPVRLSCLGCPCVFDHLVVVPRTVIGYHACRKSFAHSLVSGSLKVRDWKPSRNDYDWLGEGVYFWEHAPGRAWQWAIQRFKDDRAVVAAEIRLGRCLDLADTAYTDLLQKMHEGTMKYYRANGWTMPANAGKDQKLRRLDRLVIDRLNEASDLPTGPYFQTVRCPFEEGDPVYPGGMIKTQSHIQIAVRDRNCIASRIYLVRPDRGGR